jgi:hypothetical protein
MNASLKYILSRLEERSTVAGIAGAAVAAFSLHASPDTVSQIVNLVVIGAGMAAAAIPGGK